MANTFVVTTTADGGSGSLRDALVQASMNPGTDTITFASGVSGTLTLTGGALDVNSDVNIVGPGAGTLTISGAGGAGNVVTVRESTVSLSGLTITGGSGATQGSGNVKYAGGGGIVAVNSTLTVDHCVISGNHADASGMVGGGIALEKGSLTITNSTITGNSAAGKGGGVAAIGDAVTISNTTLRNNDSGAYGGGMYLTVNKVTIDGTVIGGNTAMMAGGGAAFSRPQTGAAEVVVSASTIDGNVAKATANGGVAAGGGLSAQVTTLELRGSTISNNRLDANGLASVHFVGAGLAVQTQSSTSPAVQDTITVVDSTISGNQAHATTAGTTVTGYGGGGFLITTNATIQNSTIADNRHDDIGGGLLGGGQTSTTIANSTVVGNEAGVSAGGLCAAPGGSPIVVRNSIVADNTAPVDPDVGVASTGAPMFDTAWSLVRNPSMGYITDSGGNLFNVDPLLGPLANNGGPTLTMLPLTGSPVINAGDPVFNGPPTTDQRGAGYPRITNGRVDMGAVETPGSGTQSDLIFADGFDGDGDLIFADGFD